MTSLRSTLAILTLLIGATLLADNPPPSSAPEMTEGSRMALIRDLNAEMVYIRRPFPMGEKGLILKNGKVLPSEEAVERMIAVYGPSVKPGDRAKITDIRFKGDNAIVFEINGGPLKKKKWFERIQISGTAGTVTPTNPNASDTANPRGTFVALVFDKHVPDLSVGEVKALLRPVFDFNAKSAVQAYMDSLPPKAKDAIAHHQVLVGMDREMVVYALGRPPKKYRDKDGDKEYEEWIYGEPPKDVQFVRFVGDEVVRLEIMKVDGEKTVRTEREVSAQPTVAKKLDEPIEPTTKPGKAPTLRRPGETAPADDTQGSADPSTPKKSPPPIPGNGPPEWRSSGVH
jgi:outer membrane protein assembly factor BamE (lipoprotein component of BamABCDE complex)